MTLFLAILLAFSPPSPSASASPEPPSAVFETLAGSWEGTGTLLGRPATFRMHWDLHAGLAVLRFENAHVAEDGTARPVLSAAAVYRVEGDPEAVWLDSRGVRIEIRWSASDDALVSTWTAPGESGRTTYRLLSTGQVEVIDEVAVGEDWRVFARATYDRV